jgi:kynureninase
MLTVQENPQLDKQSLEYAVDLDSKSISYRSEFCVPLIKQLGCASSSEEEAVYLCGNSLGLQPKQTRTLLNEELDVWAAR